MAYEIKEGKLYHGTAIYHGQPDTNLPWTQAAAEAFFTANGFDANGDEIPAPPPPAPEPQPRNLTSLEFMLYVSEVLGVGPAAVKAKIEAVADVAAIWGEVVLVEKTNAATSAFLALMVNGNQLTTGEKNAILDNWPTS